MIELASLHDQVVDLELSGSSFDNLLFYGALCYEAIYNNISFLANSMCSINSL